MTTHKKRILIILAAVLLLVFMFVMFFLDDITQHYAKPLSDNIDEKILPLYAEMKELTGIYVSGFVEPTDDIKKEINDFKIPIGNGENITVNLTYSKSFTERNLYIYDGYTTDDERINYVKIDNKTGKCTYIRYADGVIEVDGSKNSYEQFIKETYLLYNAGIEEPNWDMYSMSINSTYCTNADAYVTYKKYIPCVKVSDFNDQRSIPTGDSAYLTISCLNDTTYITAIDFYSLGMIPKEIIYATEPIYEMSLLYFSRHSDISLEILAKKDLYSELLYVNRKFAVRWIGNDLIDLFYSIPRESVPLYVNDGVSYYKHLYYSNN